MAAASEKNSFVVYSAWEAQVALLSDEDAGKLFKALFAHETGEDPGDLPPVVAMALSFMGAELDRNRQKYQEIVEKRREAGRQGGRPRREDPEAAAKETSPEEEEKQAKAKKANVFFEKQKNPINVNENDNENGNGNGNEIERAFTRVRESGFDRFWEKYPRHLDREGALEAWQALAPDDPTQERILRALEKALDSPQWLEEDGRYIPQAATWLRDRRWDNLVPLRRSGCSYDIEELEELAHFDLPEALEQ